MRGGFGGSRVARARAAAIDEHEPGDALRCDAVRFEHDAAAHAVADENGILELEVVDERHDVAAEVLDRTFLWPPRRRAVAAKVAGHGLIGLREERKLMTPVFVAAQEAVHEDQGRRAPPLANEVQSSALACGLCAATSFC